MEFFSEQSVKNIEAESRVYIRLRLGRIKKIALTVALLPLLVALFFSMTDYRLGLFVAGISLIVVLPAVITIIIINKRVNDMITEYDYFVQSGVFRIVQVRARRKVILETSMDNLQAMGKLDDERLVRYEQHGNTKLINAVCNYGDVLVGDKDATDQTDILAEPIKKAKRELNNQPHIQWLFGKVNNSNNFLLLWEPDHNTLLTLKRVQPRLLIK